MEESQKVLSLDMDINTWNGNLQSMCQNYELEFFLYYYYSSNLHNFFIFVDGSCSFPYLACPNLLAINYLF
jgi:hypothetical protein